MNGDKLLVWLLTAGEVAVLCENEIISSLSFNCTDARQVLAYCEGLYSTLMFVSEKGLVKLTINTKSKKFHPPLIYDSAKSLPFEIR